MFLLRQYGQGPGGVHHRVSAQPACPGGGLLGRQHGHQLAVQQQQVLRTLWPPGDLIKSKGESINQPTNHELKHSSC